MAKVYAIRKGRIIGKVYSWDECLEATKGYPSAEYKSFKSEEEADVYLSGEQIESSVNINKPKSSDVANIFCSGGYKADCFAFGIYIEGATNDYLSCGAFKRADTWVTTGLRSIFGECTSCLAALQLAGSLGYKRVNIYYKYEGIEKWVTGEFKSKNTVSNEYVRVFNSIVKKYGLAYRFFSVKGESGIEGMKIVDKLIERSRTQYIEESAESIWGTNYNKSNAQFQNPRLFL